MNPILLNRREAILRVAQLAGLALIGGPVLLRGGAEASRPSGSRPGFASADLALMDEIGETIIPATTTPGAKAAGIGAFMAMMVDDCYDAEQQEVFRAGLRKIDEVARTRFGRGFAAATPAERTSLLDALDAEARAQAAPRKAQPAHYFTMLKQLTIVGYFTSEVGCRAAFTYEEVPGRYEGDAPYRPGDKTDYAMPSGDLR